MDKNNNNPIDPYTEQNFKFPSISNQTLYCVLSYIYVFWLVGLLVDTKDKTVRFHVNQGIILFTVSFLSLFIINVISSFLFSIAPILAGFSAFLEVLWLIFYVGFMFIGIKNVITHQNKPLPWIGTLFSFLN